MPTAVDDIQARIAEIQSRLGLGAGSGIPADTSEAFQNVLDAVMGVSSPDGGFASASTGGTAGSGGSAVVADARRYLGVPYVWGGTDPSKGLDCSGLVQRVYGDLGISLPRVAADQARQGTPVASLAQAKPGDLVAFGSPVDHIGIYIGNNKMIVAPKRGDVVKVEDVYTTPTAIRRIIPDSSNFIGANVGNGTNAVSAASAASYGGTGNFGSLNSSYNALFSQAGAKYGISPILLAAVAKQESGFNANAVSGAGARGLMQLMPATARSLGVNALDPSQAVDGAARMLTGLVQKFGSTSLALAAYNAGAGAVQKYGGIPPYRETQNYVRNVLALAKQGGSI